MAVARRGGRTAAGRPVGHHADRPRHRGAHLRRGPGARFRALGRPAGAVPHAAGNRRRPGRYRLRHRRYGVDPLRRHAGEADLPRPDPRRRRCAACSRRWPIARSPASPATSICSAASPPIRTSPPAASTPASSRAKAPRCWPRRARRRPRCWRSPRWRCWTAEAPAGRQRPVGRARPVVAEHHAGPRVRLHRRRNQLSGFGHARAAPPGASATLLATAERLDDGRLRVSLDGVWRTVSAIVDQHVVTLRDNGLTWRLTLPDPLAAAR